MYCLDWLLSSVSSVGVERLGLVTKSGVFSGTWGVGAVLLLLSLLDSSTGMGTTWFVGLWG